MFSKIAKGLVEKYGVAVFPLSGKFPAIKKEDGGRGCLDATKDFDQIDEWAAKFPKANVGIATGPASGLVVVDIDRMEALGELDLPETLTVQTGKGLHYYYATNGHKIPNSASKLAQGVDVRGHGGYVVGPGSIHPDTRKPYKIALDAPIAPIPKHLAERLMEEDPVIAAGKIRNPERYSQKALEAAIKEVEICPQGTRNNTLNAKAYLLGRYVGGELLDERYVVDQLIQAAIKAGLKEKEALKSIESGLQDGKANPRKLETSIKWKPVSAVKEANLQDEFVMDCLKAGEMGDAMLFCQLIAGRKIYDHYAQVWLTYFQGRWQRDLTSQTTRECYDLLRSAYLDVSVRLDAKQVAAVREEKTDAANRLQAEVKALRDRCKNLGASGRLRNILGLAQGMASALSTQFDTDSFLLNCRNGTYDLRTHTFRAHRSEDMMTKMAQVHFNPDMECPRWMLFLFEICQDDWDMVIYLQKIAGLFLSGRSDYQYLFFFYGKGANGKSTFFKVIQTILHDFFISLPIDILLTKNKSAADEYHLARLKGARVVMASEIPSGRRMNESLIKDLTSNDLVTARNPYEKPFQYEPTHKLCLVGNHKPDVTGRDVGIWRRIRIFPFAHTFPEEKRRPMEEVMREFREELPGILNWMIEGYRLLLKEGLEMPDEVKKATEEYRQESDSIQAFLDECTISAGPLIQTPLKELWAKYFKWCEDNGERPAVANSRQFSIVLREKGLEIRNGTRNVTTIFGLSMISERGSS